FVYLIWNFRNNDTFRPVYFLKNRFGTHHYTTATSMESFANTFVTVNNSTRGEIRSFNILHQTINVNIIILNIGNGSIYNFRKVMWRHICSHPNCNSGCSVYQKSGNSRWKYGWLF